MVWRGTGAQMGVKVEERAPPGAASGKAPRTARGERTLRKILDAAREEFGDRGFSDSSIAGVLGGEDLEILAWASMGANVFLGLRYAVWDSADLARVAIVANRMLRKGISA